MERVGGGQEEIEGHCSTGQSPQWAVVPMEEEEEEEEGGGEEEEEEEEEGEEEGDDTGKDGKRKWKEIFKCWE